MRLSWTREPAERSVPLPRSRPFRITVMEPPHLFVDEQVSGPFESFVHRHEFHEQGSSTLMRDDWRHIAPVGVLVDPLFLNPYLRRLLTRRNELLRLEAEMGVRAPPGG